ncbi:MAG: LptE family protein [Gemmatimonadota bacterium]
MPASGRCRSLAALIAALLLSACGIRYGFSEGAFPSHVRTMAILPFDNKTPSSELQNELFDTMRAKLQQRLGVRDAAQDKADALVRGTIVSYDVDVPVAFSADPRQATSARRRLQITIDVEIIDQTTGKTLWQRKGLRAEGEYAERAEPEGRKLAIEKIVNDIVEGAQSQW